MSSSPNIVFIFVFFSLFYLQFLRETVVTDDVATTMELILNKVDVRVFTFLSLLCVSVGS